MKKKEMTIFIISIFTSIALSMGFDFAYNSINFNNGFFSAHIIWFVLFVLIYNALDKVYSIKKTFIYKHIIIVSAIISFLYLLSTYMTNTINNGVFFSKKLLLFYSIKYICDFIISYVIVGLFYNYLDSYKEKKSSSKLITFLFKNNNQFYMFFILIFLSYLPWLLNHYPGIASLDSLSQMLQAIGERPYTTHHPPLHTFIISICLHLGKFIKDYNFGILIYSLLQITICSLTFAYTLLFLEKYKISRKIQLILLLYFMASPIISNFSIIMWKDIPFALSVLWTSLFLIDFEFSPEKFVNSKQKKFLLFIATTLVALFRNNGIYCLIFLFIIILFSKNQYKKYLLKIMSISFISFFVITGLIFKIANVNKGDQKEAFSVFMQQFAAIRKYKSDKLTPKEIRNIDVFFKSKNYYKVYDPTFADYVKNEFSEEYINTHKLDMLKNYMKLCFKFPLLSIYSFVAGSFGYYNPNIVGWKVYNGIDSNEKLNIYQKSKIKINYINKVNDFNNNHNISFFGTINSCGFYFLLFIVVMGYYLYNRNYRLLFPSMLLLSVVLTAMLSPVFCERRYVFSLYLLVPILLVFCFKKDGTIENKKRMEIK